MTNVSEETTTENNQFSNTKTKKGLREPLRIGHATL